MIETPEEFRRRIGQVELGRSHHFETRGGVIRDLVLAVLLVGVLVGGAFWLIWPRLLPLTIGIAAFAVYCAIAYFVRVRPNHDEVRQPFGSIYRASDDVNQFLILLVIVFALGRFISIGIVDGVRLLARGRLPHEPPIPDK